MYGQKGAQNASMLYEYYGVWWRFLSSFFVYIYILIVTAYVAIYACIYLLHVHSNVPIYTNKRTGGGIVFVRKGVVFSVNMRSYICTLWRECETLRSIIKYTCCGVRDPVDNSAYINIKLTR